MEKPKLVECAEVALKNLEKILQNRGDTGYKKWELEILFASYEALETPMQDRKYGLDKITKKEDIKKSGWWQVKNR